MEWVFLKNMPLTLLVKFFPLHAGYILLAFGNHLRQKRGKIFLRAKIDAMKELGSVLQKRKMIQKKRRVSPLYLETMFDKSFLERTTPA